MLLANFGGYGDFRSEMSGIIAAKILKIKFVFINSPLLHKTTSLE